VPKPFELQDLLLAVETALVGTAEPPPGPDGYDRPVCGRYTLTEPAGLQLRFGLVESSDTRIAPRFNVAPSQGVPIVVRTPLGSELRAAAWGFRPVWVREDARRPPPINARAETAATNGLFRDALARRRCLIPADGFYEWRSVPGQKKRLPVRFTLKDGGVFGFAGLFTGPRGAQVEDASCAILTTSPNALVAPVHNRMPVILRREDEALWLDPSVRDPVAALACCRAYPAELLACYDVDPAVGNALIDGPELVAPLI
jgi:putative SOS response-associated peptidase YedK